MTERKLDATLHQVLLRYEKVLQLIDADLTSDNFSRYQEHQKQADSLSEMIASCLKVKNSLQPDQKYKKDVQKYEFGDNTVSSIQVRIGDLKIKLQKKMKENSDKRKALSPNLKIKSPFSVKSDPVLIDITS